MSDNRFKSLSKVIISISGVVILSKILGFAKNIVMASAFGASIETDLITLANTLVANTEYIITQTLATAVVPIYIRVKGEASDDSKKIFVSNAIKLFVLIAAGLTLILFCGSPIVSRIIAPSYESEASGKLAFYIRLLSPILLPFVLISLYKALLNAHERYLPGELVSIIGSVMMIATILALSFLLGTDTILIGLWASSVISAVFLGILSRKLWTIKKGNPFKDPDIIALLKMVAPLLFGYAMIFINQQIDKVIVSGMAAGTVTAMSYGNTLSQLVVTLIASFCMVMYTRLSVHSAEGEHEQNASFIVNTLSIAFTILIPITIITVSCSKDIVKIIYEHGAFDATATREASYALAGYGLMFIPYTIKSLFSRYLYSNKNTKSPVRNNVIGIACNIALSLALYKPLGVFGVTFASSVAELVAGVLNIISAKKINRHISFAAWRTNLKYWLSGGLICVGSIVAFRYFIKTDMPSLLRFAICVLIGLAGYIAPCFKLIKRMLKTVLHKKQRASDRQESE